MLIAELKYGSPHRKPLAALPHPLQPPLCFILVATKTGAPLGVAMLNAGKFITHAWTATKPFIYKAH